MYKKCLRTATSTKLQLVSIKYKSHNPSKESIDLDLASHHFWASFGAGSATAERTDFSHRGWLDPLAPSCGGVALLSEILSTEDSEAAPRRLAPMARQRCQSCSGEDKTGQCGGGFEAFRIGFETFVSFPCISQCLSRTVLKLKAAGQGPQEKRVSSSGLSTSMNDI